jgi:hypothetical protein
MLDVWELIWGCSITFIVAWCFSINVSVKVRTVLTGETVWRCIGLPMSYGLHLFPSVRFPGFYSSTRHYLIESDAPSHFCWWIRHWCLVSLSKGMWPMYFIVYEKDPKLLSMMILVCDTAFVGCLPKMGLSFFWIASCSKICTQWEHT